MEAAVTQGYGPQCWGGGEPFPFQADCKGAAGPLTAPRSSFLGLLDELEDPQNPLEFRPRSAQPLLYLGAQAKVGFCQLSHFKL